MLFCTIIIKVLVLLSVAGERLATCWWAVGTHLPSVKGTR